MASSSPPYHVGSQHSVSDIRSARARAGRLGGLTSWASNRSRMLRAAGAGNEALLRQLGNRSAVRLHFTRLAERRWQIAKAEGARKTDRWAR